VSSISAIPAIHFDLRKAGRSGDNWSQVNRMTTYIAVVTEINFRHIHNLRTFLM
jgi:hypothetical protein